MTNVMPEGTTDRRLKASTENRDNDTVPTQRRAQGAATSDQDYNNIPILGHLFDFEKSRVRRERRQAKSGSQVQEHGITNRILYNLKNKFKVDTMRPDVTQASQD
jgi:hypothetical protein